jgi:uncharacterized OsmC-like protein
MRMVLETEERLRLTGDGESVAFEANEATTLSPFHLLAASLATCTYSVLYSWAEHASLPLDGIEIVVAWRLGGDPVRVSEMRMELAWPDLPASRREAARRAAAFCTVHRTLELGSHVETTVREDA